MSSEVQRTTPAVAKASERRALGHRAPARQRKALELIASRGREVIGVRHLVQGGTARIGDVREALARVPMNEVGGRALVVGEVTQSEYLLHVPPRARARWHSRGAIPRLLVGPETIALAPGDRAVLVLGQLQVRARIVDIEALSTGPRWGSGIAGWIVFVAAVYLAALTVCAVVAPPQVPRLPRGALHHVQAELLQRLPSR